MHPPHTPGPRGALLVAALTLCLPGAVLAGVVVEDRPVSLISSNLITEHGVLCVPLADVAKALGGVLRVDAKNHALTITPGSGGVLAHHSTPLSAFSRRLKMRGAQRIQPEAPGRAKPPGLEGMVAGQNPTRVRIGGSDVMDGIEDYERIMLGRPNPLMPLPLLAKLLGGAARFDPSRNTWVLPPGGPNDPLAFR